MPHRKNCHMRRTIVYNYKKDYRPEGRTGKGRPMKPIDLTEDQKAKLKSCKDSAELKSMLNGMGIELTDEQLEKAAGGQDWNSCGNFVDPCPPYGY